MKVFAFMRGVQDAPDGAVHLVYEVVEQDAKQLHRYAADYHLDSALSLATTLDNLKQKIAQDAVSRGANLSTGDVIVFGAPVVKDAASADDSTRGITSDKDAVELGPTTKEEPIRVASNPVVDALKWLIS